MKNKVQTCICSGPDKVILDDKLEDYSSLQHVSEIENLVICGENIPHGSFNLIGITRMILCEIALVAGVAELTKMVSGNGGKVFVVNPPSINARNLIVFAIIFLDVKDGHIYTPIATSHLYINNSTLQGAVFQISTKCSFFSAKISSEVLSDFWERFELKDGKKKEIKNLYDSHISDMKNELLPLEKIEKFNLGPNAKLQFLRDLSKQFAKGYRPREFFYEVERKIKKDELFREALKVSYVRQLYDLEDEQGFFRILLWLNKTVSDFQTSFRFPIGGILVLMLSFGVALFFESGASSRISPSNASFYIGRYFHYLFQPWQLKEHHYFSILIGYLSVILIPTFSFMIKHTYNRLANYKW